MKTLFISHASVDEPIVKLLTKLLKNTTSISTDEILCTSLPGSDLKPGVAISSEIRKHLKDAKVVLGIITQNSLFSEYVMFELGVGWVHEKALAILDVGIDFKSVPAPLRETNALRISEKRDLCKLIDHIAEKAEVNKEAHQVIEEEVDDFILKCKGLNTNKSYRFEKIHPVPGRTYYPQDFNKVWPQTMFISEKFWSISVMHPRLWKNDAAIMGIYTLGGVKHVYSDALIKRIFVIYTADELQMLESTIRLHLEMKLSIKYLTIKEYDKLCENSCEMIADHKGTQNYCIPAEAFTISHLNYPTEFPNDSCLIHYKINKEDRRVQSFTTVDSGNREEVSVYERFFREAWKSAHEIDQTNLSDILQNIPF